MIPVFLPLLRKGAGARPKDGGCLVQVASFLHDGQSWRDDTTVVDPTLRFVAIKINDIVSDTYRPRLAPLACELVGTGIGGDQWPGFRPLAVRLAVWGCRRILHLMDDPRSREAVDAAAAWADCPCEWHRILAHAAWNRAYQASEEPRMMPRAGAATAAASVVYAVCYGSDGEAESALNCVVETIRAAADDGVDADDVADAVGEVDAAAHAFLADLIAEHRRLTGHTVADGDEGRYRQVCELIGATPAPAN